jgi:threonyl-tRNA synthetase
MSSEYSIEVLRHSAAHIMAMAVKDLFPEAKFGMGPAVDDGFYYDFDLPRTLSQDDLKEIQKRMKKLMKSKTPFRQFTLSYDEAIDFAKKNNQQYKLELIEDLALKEYSFYECGNFIDLCKGPHIEHSAQINAVKLLRVAGAYWKGSEKNKMLQRIYGTAFFSKEDLVSYLTKVEEAQKRDHRLLGKQLDLFSITDEVGSGLVLWHPKGARVRNIIENYWIKEHYRDGYDLLYTPHIGKADLWHTSGHLDFYADDMYAPIKVDSNDFYIKPMNCPFHVLIYKGQHRSYRELPIRYAELGNVYRNERSGVLHGLMRVRGFTQDDAHIICTPEQVNSEILKVLKICFKVLKTFGFEKFKVFLSTKPEKCVGETDRWHAAENALRQSIESLELPYEVDDGGGAFYGPKIDIKIEDAIGRYWQCSTIQFDFNLPERFDMTYIGSDGSKKRPYMIHRALFGSLERFFGILIEHFSGKLPTWLAPVQVKLLTVTESVTDYCEKVKEALIKEDIRIEVDTSNEKIGYKVRQGIKQKVPYMIILGHKEEEESTLAVRSRDAGDLGAFDMDKFIDHIKSECKLIDE